MPLLDEKKTEQLNGTVYGMSPSADYRHAMVNLNIYSQLKEKLKDSLCLVFVENLDLKLDEEGNYAIPDVMVVCDRNKIEKGTYKGIPHFIVETLSPSTASRDRKIKMGLYAALGVEEYWIVDPLSRALEIYCLQDGSYFLEEAFMLETDKGSAAYNAETMVTLKAFPSVSLQLQMIFDNIE